MKLAGNPDWSTIQAHASLNQLWRQSQLCNESPPKDLHGPSGLQSLIESYIRSNSGKLLIRRPAGSLCGRNSSSIPLENKCNDSIILRSTSLRKHIHGHSFEYITHMTYSRSSQHGAQLFSRPCFFPVWQGCAGLCSSTADASLGFFISFWSLTIRTFSAWASDRHRF